MFYSIPTMQGNCNASRLEVPFLKGNRTEDASWAESVENVRILSSVFLFSFFFEFELLRGQPCWFILYQRRAGRANWWRGGDSSVLERRTLDRKVAGLNPGRSGGRIFFCRVNFLCWLLFRYQFLPRVTEVARKRYLLFCQKYRWQVTATHVCTLHMWLCMKWRDMVHSCIVYKERGETAAVSRGTSNVTTKQRCK